MFNVRRFAAWLLFGMLSAVVACGGSSDAEIGDEGTTADELKATKDELVACKSAKDGKGELHLFWVEKATDDESKYWKKSVVAVGVRGRLADENISHSQGDQPDVVSIEKDDDSYELSFLEKTGRATNSLLFTSGGGEDEEFSFLSVTKIELDAKDKTATIEGTEQFTNDSRKVSFKKCDVNKSLLKDLAQKL